MILRPAMSVGRGGAVMSAALLALFVAALVAARVSTPAFIAVGLALIAGVGYAALRWPRAAIVLVVLSPVLDRYLVAGLVPPQLSVVTHVFSEGLLLVVGLVVAAVAWRTGRLVPALWHPASVALAGFVGAALISALLNLVPPAVAAVGIGFTVDAAACFYLPRLVGFSLRQAAVALAAIGALVVIAALVALGQALLSPNILGLSALHGRFGEVYRLASFFGDPNVFGAFLVATAPFALFGATGLRPRRRQLLLLAAAFLLVLALWLSFSRGAWLALIIGPGLVALLLDRRALVLGVIITALAFGTAATMPRDLLLLLNRGGGGATEAAERPNLIDSTVGRLDTVSQGRDLRTLFIVNALPILRDHPALGVGPGRYGGATADIFGTPIYQAYGTDRLFTHRLQSTVDNFWLHLLVELGIIGFACFLWAVLAAGLGILRAAWRAEHGLPRVLLQSIVAAIAGLAVNSVSTMLLEANSVAYLFWFLLGIGSLVAASVPLRTRSMAAAPTT